MPGQGRADRIDPLRKALRTRHVRIRYATFRDGR